MFEEKTQTYAVESLPLDQPVIQSLLMNPDKRSLTIECFCGIYS